MERKQIREELFSNFIKDVENGEDVPTKFECKGCEVCYGGGCFYLKEYFRRRNALDLIKKMIKNKIKFHPCYFGYEIVDQFYYSPSTGKWKIIGKCNKWFNSASPQNFLNIISDHIDKHKMQCTRAQLNNRFSKEKVKTEEVENEYPKFSESNCGKKGTRIRYKLKKGGKWTYLCYCKNAQAVQEAKEKFLNAT